MSSVAGERALTDRVANLVIAGTGKSGTSSMFAYLAAHPDICGASVKETHFFDPVLHGEPVPPLDEYAGFWSHAAGERYRLEATPLYCVGGEAMLDAFEDHLGDDLRVLILLRDPIERLAVNFAYMKAKLGLPGIDTFDQYVDRCLALRAEGRDTDVESGATSWVRSFYGDWLGPWMDRLGPRLKLVWFEDLAEDAEACVRDVCGWLGIDESAASGIDYRIHNPTTAPRSRLVQRTAVVGTRVGRRLLDASPGLKQRVRTAYLRVNGRPNEEPPVSVEARARLETALADSNERLSRMLVRAGHDQLPPWLPPQLHDAPSEVVT